MIQQISMHTLVSPMKDAASPSPKKTSKAKPSPRKSSHPAKSSKELAAGKRAAAAVVSSKLAAVERSKVARKAGVVHYDDQDDEP